MVRLWCRGIESSRLGLVGVAAMSDEGTSCLAGTGWTWPVDRVDLASGEQEEGQHCLHMRYVWGPGVL